MSINENNIKKHLPKELFAAHWAYVLAFDNDFRSSYGFVKDNLDKIPDFDYQDVIGLTKSLGGPGNLNLEEITLSTTKSQKAIEEKMKFFENKMNLLLEK